MDELNLQAERAAFEAWAKPYGLVCDFIAGNSGDKYILDETVIAWESWLAARRSAPVAQLDADLPPLPTLGQPLLNLISDYGLARTDGLTDVGRLDLWDSLILGIKEYATTYAKSGIVQYVERIRHLERELAERSKEVPEWIILQRVGCTPEMKGPLIDTKQTEAMLRELYDLYPGCVCTLAAMPRTSYPQSGREWIDMYGDKRRKPLPAYIDGRTAGTASEAAPDPVVEANRQLLLDRSRVGVKKYGVTLGAAGLAGHHLMQHALEEALDLANYLQTLMQTERAHTMPDGWKPVPQQYTDAQLAAGVAQYEAVAGGAVSAESICGVIYDGMIAAAPSTQEGAK